MTFRGRVANGVVVLPSAADLPDGTLVDVTPLNDQATAPAAAILAAMEKLPKVPREWADELEQAIAAGHRPPSRAVVFPDEPGHPENG